MCPCRRSRSRSSSRERMKRERARERRSKGLPPFKEEHLISKCCIILQRCTVTCHNDNNNNNTRDSDYGAVIMTKSFREFTLPRQQWSLLNRFRASQGHCGANRKTWHLTDTDLCSCGETQTMSHIVESCPLTKLNGGLSQLHSADDAAIAWLTNCGS